MVRGIERGAIFQDEQDRKRLLDRISGVFQEERVVCYAWAFLSNHVHIFIRPLGSSISRPLRRVLTGYVGEYNRRHRRWGHLFQNRYKSVLVEEEPYFQELVRYIHLNPVRAKVVKDMGELGRYRWSGHRMIVRREEVPWMGVGEVLERFGRDRKTRMRRYKEFIRDGWDQGRRPELVGGGLIKSLGGWEAVKGTRRRKGESRVMSDARVLGSGEFVERALKESEEELSRREKYRRRGIGLAEFSGWMGVKYGMSPSELRSGVQARSVSRVRTTFIWVAVREMGYTGKEVAQWLGITPSAVSKALNQGRLPENQEEISRIVKELST